MFDIDKLSVDPAKAKDGAWVEYLRGSQLRIARANNKDAEAFRLRKAIDSADVFNAGGEEAEALAYDVETETLAYYVLKDWDGIERAGKALKYTPELGMEFLADPRFADFRDDVLRIARNREHYREANEVAAVNAVKTAAAS